MEKRVPLTEEQLRNVINKTIKSALLAEGIDEVSWFKRAGNAVRNAFDNAKTAVGGAAAGLKAGVKYGGTTAAAAGANDYKAKRNAELANSRKQEADAAIEEFRNEYKQKVGELNKWKASEIRQIKQMYGADAFAKKADNAQGAAASARKDMAQFNQYDLNNAGVGQGSYRNVAESIDKIVGETIKKYIG